MEVCSWDDFFSGWIKKFACSSRFMEIELSEEILDQNVEKVESWLRLFSVWVLDVCHVYNFFDCDC